MIRVGADLFFGSELATPPTLFRIERVYPGLLDRDAEIVQQPREDISDSLHSNPPAERSPR